jgi:hypothetical protein
MIQIPTARFSIKPESTSRIISRAYLGIVLLWLGFSDRALAQSTKAIAEARRLAYPATLAMSLTVGASTSWRELVMTGGPELASPA